MDNELYIAIIDDFRKLYKPRITKMLSVIDLLIEKYCTSDGPTPEAIRSMVSYSFQMDTRSSVCKVNWATAYQMWSKGTTLMEIADKYSVSSALVAQRVVDHAKKQCDKYKKSRNICMTDSAQIPDGRLAFEVMLCQYSDPMYGVHSNFIARTQGLSFEKQIEEMLAAAGVEFLCETDLREQNYDCTPDFRLLLPIILTSKQSDVFTFDVYKGRLDGKCSVCKQPFKTDHSTTNKSTNLLDSDEHQHCYTSQNIINWIECKSLFASLSCHKDYCKRQYDSYANRFGRGLVIYAHGCVQDVLEENPKFIVLHSIFTRRHTELIDNDAKNQKPEC